MNSSVVTAVNSSVGTATNSSVGIAMNSSVGRGVNKGPKVHTDIHQRPMKNSHRHQPGPIKRTRRKPPAVDDEVTKHLLRANEEFRPTIDRCCVIYHGVQTNVTRWRQLGRRVECISSGGV